MFWEGKAIEFQKDEDKKLTNYDKSGEASFSVPSLSLSSFTAIHLIFRRVCDLFCCIVVWRWRIFELSCWRTSRWAVCSVSAQFNWDFNFSWTQLRELKDTKMHEWPWQIHLAHLEVIFMQMQTFDEWEQHSQAIEDIRSNWRMVFASTIWFSDFWCILTNELQCSDDIYSHLNKH